MVQWRLLVAQAREETQCPLQLLFNSDEMWRKVVRDRGSRTYQLSPSFGVGEAAPTLSLEYAGPRVRAKALAKKASWVVCDFCIRITGLAVLVFFVW